MTKRNRPIIGINAHYQEDNHRWYKVPVNYMNAVYRAGGIPLIFPCDPDKEELLAYLQQVDGMIFTGGSDYPADLYGDTVIDSSDPMDHRRARTDIMLMKAVLRESEVPVMCICAGQQLLAIAEGGKLIQHIENPDMHGQHKETTHPVRIKNGKWLKSIFKDDTIIVNSNHHQAVASESFPGDYVVTALSDDGIIEAMEYSGERFILGVQWHPERIDNEEHKKAIFEYFINVTRERISI